MQDIKFEHIKEIPRERVKKEMQEFERKKNTLAFIYSLITFSLLFLLFFIKNWPPPIEVKIPQDELVEVLMDDNINLGNDENGGLGDIQPLKKGDFAPPDAGNPEPSPNQSNQEEEPSDPITSDRDDDEAPLVNKPPFKPKNPGRVINTAPANPNPTSQPTNNTPPAPQPKVGGPWRRLGGTGTGNGADRDNGFSNQGNGRGTGDAGNPFGTPNGTGQRLSNANLRNSGEINRLTSQSGTNYKGKVTLVLRVDDNGSVTGVTSNTPSPASREAKSFANEIAYKMKFPAGADGRTARIVLDFDF